MALFVTRVELHQATFNDYENLHTHMQQAGFSRTIVSSTNQRYRLPTAEYCVETAQPIQTVLNSARQAANATGKANEILVSETVRTLWIDLPLA